MTGGAFRLTVPLVLGAVAALNAQSDVRIRGRVVHLPTRLVIDTNSSCRSAPSLTSRVSSKIPLGTPVKITRETRTADGTWYLAAQTPPTTPCWLMEKSTFLWDSGNRETVALTVLAHLRARKDVTFEDYVEAESLLTESFSWRRTNENPRVSPLLRFRILQMFDRAAVVETFPDNSRFAPWFASHGDIFRYYEPDGAWFVDEHNYWDLFEANKNASWAEELAWFASTLPARSDECYSECILRRIESRQQAYWTRFPNGPHVADALTKAGAEVKYAADMACDRRDPTLFAESSVSPEAVISIRDSLSKVTHPAKFEILKSLDNIDRKCSR